MKRPRRGTPRKLGHPGLTRESYRLLPIAAAGQAPIRGGLRDAAGPDEQPATIKTKDRDDEIA